MDRSGIKTTEFWISVFLFLLGAGVYIVDSLGAGSTVAGQIVGGLVSLAGVLGYTIPRAGVKKRALEAQALARLQGVRPIANEILEREKKLAGQSIVNPS